MVNVSRVILSPRLGAQSIVVHRYRGVWRQGEFVPEKTKQLSTLGIVTVAAPKDLQQLPEGDRITGGIKVLTKIPLQQTNQNGTGDVIVWREAKYKVMTVYPDIDYGFFRSICTRLEGDGIG